MNDKSDILLIRERARLQRGQAVLTAALFFTAASLIILGGVARPLLQDIENIRQLIESKQSYHLAEGSVEDVAYRLSHARSVSSLETLTEGIHTATTTVVDMANTKEVLARGDVRDTIRKIKTVLIEGTGINFFYGAHIGEGGLIMTSNATINGNAYSNGNIVGSSNSVINGDAAAAGTISSPDPTVTGSSSEGVAPVPLPVIDLDFWRAAANVNNDPIVGDYEQDKGSSVLGPRKIEGNFTLDSNATMTITGPLHVTGNFAMNSNTQIFLDESFGSSGTVIVVDGTIVFNSNAEVHGTSASPKGYILFVTPSTSASAIEINSNALLETALYATGGTVEVNSNGDLVAVTAYQLELESNAEINYDIGLANAIFTSGPAGGFTLGSWEEVE